VTAGQVVAEILVARRVVEAERLEGALEVQSERGGDLTDILIGQNVVTEARVLQTLAEELGCEYRETIDPGPIEWELVSHLPITYAKTRKVIPLGDAPDGALEVATADPLDSFTMGDLLMILGREIRLILAPSQTILDAINKVYDRQSGAEQVVEDVADEFGGHGALDSEVEDLLEATDEAPVIRLVNTLLFQAVKDRASDIHFEPGELSLSVRFRVDGVLRHVVEAPSKSQASIVSRLKIMAGLNIAEKRLPQDGRIRIKIAGKDIDVRVSTIPTAHGERVVLRLLERAAVLLDLDTLGFTQENLEAMDKLIHRPHGIVLVTGPTGSGKTTTLYACLTKINSPDRNILTVEDPIEYQLAGISQMQVSPKIDLTFASGLRSFLRQDPDIIMVGEIRDLETAEIAIQASLTGHLVLSTIHTNDAAGAFTRLTDMGTEPFLVASTLVAAMAQRLVRMLCKACKQPYTPLAEELREIGLDPGSSEVRNATFFRPVGCPACLEAGYIGRSGIYEMLQVDDEVRALVMQRMDAGTIKRKAVANGMRTLRMDGAFKALEGRTSIEEILRVTQEDVD
jgi:general secretion pathway protein E